MDPPPDRPAEPGERGFPWERGLLPDSIDSELPRFQPFGGIASHSRVCSGVGLFSRKQGSIPFKVLYLPVTLVYP